MTGLKSESFECSDGVNDNIFYEQSQWNPRQIKKEKKQPKRKRSNCVQTVTGIGPDGKKSFLSSGGSVKNKQQTERMIEFNLI